MPSEGEAKRDWSRGDAAARAELAHGRRAAAPLALSWRTVGARPLRSRRLRLLAVC
jgi:hypothetical protein